MKNIRSAFGCAVGWHRWRVNSANVTADSGGTITLIWTECHDCGKSSLDFIWGSGSLEKKQKEETK